MTRTDEPQRLTEGGEHPGLGELREALRLARREGPSAAQRARIAAGLGVGEPAPSEDPRADGDAPAAEVRVPGGTRGGIRLLASQRARLGLVITIGVAALGAVWWLASHRAAEAPTGADQRSGGSDSVSELPGAAPAQPGAFESTRASGSDSVRDALRRGAVPHRPAPPASASKRRAGTGRQRPQARAPEVEARPSTRSPQVEASEVETRPSTREATKRAAVPAQREASASLDELTLLHRARAHARSAPAQALALVSEHEARFPHSAFVQEREVIAVEALWFAGKQAAAQERASRFLARFPGSAHRRRLEALLLR